MNDLNTLMHARVDDERPDLDRLLSGAVHDGHRIRRRRTIGYAGAGLVAGVVAGTTVGAVTLFGGPHATDATEVAPATSGPAGAASRNTGIYAGPGVQVPLRAGQKLALGHRVTGTVVACSRGKADPVGGNPDCLLPPAYVVEGGSTIPGTGTGLAIVLTGPTQAVEDLWTNGFQSPLLDGYQGLTYALSADSPLVQPVYQGQAVAIHVAGWKQIGEVADDKQSLTGPGGAMADIVWRPASDHDTWVHDSDKGDNASTWTSPVHDGVFVTIQGGPGTSHAEIQALGASLTWK